MKRNPKTIGFHKCSRQGCDKSADTRQMVKGQNHYLYSVCPDCKMDQSTGAIAQTYLWNHTEWCEGQPEVSPPNLIETQAKTPAELASEAETDLFEPDEQQQEPLAQVSEAEGQKVPLAVKLLLGGLALGLTAIGVKGAMVNMQAVK